MKLDGGLYFDFDKLYATVKEEVLSREQIIMLRGLLNNKMSETSGDENMNLIVWLEGSPKIVGELVSDVYDNYKTWCIDNRRTVPSKIMFSKQLKKILCVASKTISINGKSHRIYVYE